MAALWLFDDPFQAAEVFGGSALPAVVNVVFLTAFIAAVLMFWLCILECVWRSTAV